LGISRQAWYQAIRRQREQDDKEQRVLDFVQDVRRRQPRIGTRKLRHLMQAQADPPLSIGRDRLFTLLRAHRLLVSRLRAYHKTTHSHHRFRCHPNLLKPGPEQVAPSRAEQVWVADITYLPTQDGVGYLSLVTDAYSRKIVGYHVHDSLQARDVAKAFRQALKQRNSTLPLIHHSDRGVQYCARSYQRLHERHGVQCSMTDGYDCYQNALAEWVNGILKTEFLLHRPKDLAQARKMVKESIAIYNHERPHLSLQCKTPDAVHRARFE
jgi:putative transposase